MSSFLLNYLKNKGYQKNILRTKVGVAAAILGLLSNALLFAGKIVIGLISGSVSIMADAINNLSDTASSLITLVGFRVAGKPADNEHPYGHERFEAISGLMVSILVILVGFQFLQTAFDKIRHPADLTLTLTVFVVLALSLIIKIWQSRMYKGFGKAIKSDTLKATGQDSLNDVITTITVLFSAAVEYFTGWHIDGYVGFLIALYIMYSGVSMIRDFINELLGSRPTQEELSKMEEKLSSYDMIFGFHDLLIHSYGPLRRFGSVHIELDESWTLREADEVLETIERDFKESLDVDLVCHPDPVAVEDTEYMRIYQELQRIVTGCGLGLRMHDFRLNQKSENCLSFDLVIPPKCPVKDEELYKQIKKKVQETIGDYEIRIQFDYNYLL